MSDRVYYTAKEIAEGVRGVAEKIDLFYANATEDDPVVAVCVLKGGVIFFADLVRQLHFPLVFDFIGASSYGSARESSGTVRITRDVETPLEGRRVLLIDDLVDSGSSLDALKREFLRRGASDVRCAVLVDKKVERTFQVDFAALRSDPVFFAGYGLDDEEKKRELPDLMEIS